MKACSTKAPLFLASEHKLLVLSDPIPLLQLRAPGSLQIQCFQCLPLLPFPSQVFLSSEFFLGTYQGTHASGLRRLWLAFTWHHLLNLYFSQGECWVKRKEEFGESQRGRRQKLHQRHRGQAVLGDVQEGLWKIETVKLNPQARIPCLERLGSRQAVSGA